MEAREPKIRFKGFTDPWEQRKVSELFSITRGNVLPTSETELEQCAEKPYPVYSSQTKQNGLMGYYSEYLFDTAITWTTDGANAGTVKFRKGPFYCTNVCGVLVSETGFANSAVAAALDNIAWKHVSHVGNPKLMNNVMAQIEINVPSSLSEQFLISGFIDQLDNLITLHQRKLDSLENVKKSMLEKMFPKPGESIPELRFKGFTDPWEQRKLGDVADRYDNLRIPIAANLRVAGTTPYYGANGIQDYVEGYTHDGEFVLVAEDGANDLKNYPVRCVNGRIWVNNHAHVLQGKPELCNNPFLAYSINKADIESILVGSGRAKLNAEIMMGISLWFPQLDEQMKIGSFFAVLDNLITLHQRKLDSLESTKKSLLEKMFV